MITMLRAFLLLLMFSGPAAATPSELRGLVRAGQPAGCSNYRFLFWNFYRAELWSDSEQLPGDNFALSLEYRSEFTREELVEASIEEIKRISGRSEANLTETRRELEVVFRNVVKGDRITAWRASANELLLFLNGAPTGVITRDVDPFLAIWLGVDSRHPEGREALLSGRCDG